MKPHNVLLSLILLLFPLTATAAGRPEPASKSLSPEKIQQIQAIGQAVLNAKASQTPDPEMTQLRQRVEELRKSIEKLRADSISTPTVSLADQTAQNNNPTGSKREQSETELRHSLRKLRDHRTKMQTTVDDSSTDHHTMVKKNALNKVREIEDELDKTLQDPPEERTAKLQKLQERLVSKSRVETAPDTVKTPTISTIVRHREE